MSKFVKLGAQFRVNVADGSAGGIAGNQTNPRITVLADGRFAVVYQSDYAGFSADIDPKVMIFNADGSFFTSVPITPYAPGGLQTMPVIAARADGGFGMVFTDDRHLNGSTADASGANIHYVPVSATGVVGTAIAIADFNNFAGASSDALLNPVIATLSSGRQVVVYEQVYGGSTDHDIRLNVVGTDGTTLQFSTTAGATVDAGGGLQANPAVAAAGNKAMVVYADAGNISAKIFDGGTNAIGSKITIATAASGTTPAITALDDHRFVVTYSYGGSVSAKIYDTTASTLSSEFQITSTGAGTGLTVSATSDGGFVAAYALNNDIFARRFNSAGTAIGSEFLVNSFADGTQSAPTIAVSGDHLLVAWTDGASRSGDGSPTSVQAQAFALASSASFAGVVQASDVTRKGYNIFDAAPLFSTSGFDGNAVVKYQFYDSTPAGGSWTLYNANDGLHHNQPANQTIDVSREQLATAKFYVGPIGETDDLWVRASDGVNWSPWTEFHLTAVNQKPVVTPTAASRTATHNQVFTAANLFSATGGDDIILQYEVWDTGGNGRWILNGTPLPANAANRVYDFEMAGLTYQAGGGTDQLYVRAHDGYEWGAWSSAFTVTGVNNKPLAAAITPSQTLGHSAASVPVTSLFSFGDGDGDTIAKYSFWDTEGNGAWYVNGVKQATNAEIVVTPADIGNTFYMPGAAGTTDHLYFRVNDGSVWSDWAQATVTAGPNQKPVATPTAASRTATNQQSFNASSLFNVTDGDNDTIQKYSFWDTGGNGHFRFGGTDLAANTELTFLANQLSGVTYVAGHGTDQLYVRAFDGREWSNWTSAFTITGPADTAPVVSLSYGGVATFAHGNSSIGINSLFNYTDADQDTAVKYTLWDTEGNGHFVVNGVVQATNAEIVITAAQLLQTTYVAGAAGTADHLYFRAFDGWLWSNWSSAFTMTAGANAKPVVTHDYEQYGINLGAGTAASFMFGATDGDNDTIQKYRLWDDNADPTSGYWSVGGVAQNAKASIEITAAQVASTKFATRGYAVNDDLYVQAFDGIEWGAWVKFVGRGDNAAPYIASAPDVTATHNQNVTAGSLFNALDSDHDDITKYELWDSTADPASGHWVVDGVAQGSNVSIVITAAQLASTSFQSGSGSDNLYVRAFDGALWSGWEQFYVNAPANNKPVVAGANVQALAGTAVSARGLFTETDSNNDTMIAYQFWDDNAGAGSGYFIVNGEVQAAGRNIDVTAAQLAQASFVAGTYASLDRVYERAFDGLHWSDWHALTVTAI